MNPLQNAEDQILAHLIADNELYWQYCPKLNDSFFSNSDIWCAYKKIISDGKPANLITISTEIGGDSFTRITSICSKIKYDIDFNTWIEFLSVEVRKQKCIKILSRINEAILNEKIDGIEAILQDSLNELSENTVDHKNMIDHVKDMLNHIELVQTGKHVTGFPTGISGYDAFGGGLQLTDLTIIAGGTSQGKTTFALNVAYYNASIGNYVAMFSLEMSLRQLTARLTAIDTNSPSKDILRGTANLVELKDKLGKILNNRILLDNTRNSSLESIISKMRYFISRFKCKLFFVDYLQLITYHKKGNSTEQNLADICRTFKNFAKENEVSIVVLCQLNRDTQGNTEPKLNRLRGSGQIEEAADNVIFVHRPMPSQYGEPELANLIQSKGRNSGTCDYQISFEGNIPTYRNA